VVSEPGLAHLIIVLALLLIEPTLFREKGMDTHRPPHFDDTNFPYYSARMAYYIEAIDLCVWRLSHSRGMKPPNNLEKLTTSDKKEILLNARPKNCLYEIWLKLHGNFQSSLLL
jgi:hypothetical protein